MENSTAYGNPPDETERRKSLRLLSDVNLCMAALQRLMSDFIITDGKTELEKAMEVLGDFLADETEYHRTKFGTRR